MDKQYHKKKYNCAHLVLDVWEIETGEVLPMFLHNGGFNIASLSNYFNRVKEPNGPALVLMKRKGYTHMGVYLRGRIIHITELGVQFVHPSIATLGFNCSRYYERNAISLSM